MGDWVDGVYYDDTSIATAPTPYYNPTQQFGTFDSSGNLIPYGSNTSIATPPFFGGGTFGSGGTPGGSDFWTAFTKGITSATSILGVRYAVPQLNPGQVIQTGPGGTSFMSQAQSGGALQTTTLGGVGSGTLLLLLGAGVIAAMMFSGKGH